MHPPDEDDAATVSSMRAGARRALPLAVAVGGFGVSFGVLAGTAGLSPAAAIAMSLTTFAGSAQFAAVSVLGDGGAMAGAVLAAVLLNARYLPIGASVAPAMTGSPLRRFLEAQLVVDESWAIGHLGEGRFDRGRILGAGLVLYAAWTLGTVAGASAGTGSATPRRSGWTPPSPHCSWPCWPGRSPAAGRSPPPCSAR